MYPENLQDVIAELRVRAGDQHYVTYDEVDQLTPVDRFTNQEVEYVIISLKECGIVVGPSPVTTSVPST
jgi:hypothetical protein